MFYSFIYSFWNMASSISLYMFIGFAIAGIMNYFFSVKLITNELGTNSKLSVIKAAIFGIPIPLCSCSILPVASNLKSLGASKAAVLAFLIITPVTGIESIYLTWSVLGYQFALSRVLVVVIIGITAGFTAIYFNSKKTQVPINTAPKEEIKTCCHTNKANPIRDFFYYSFYELPKSLSSSLVYGIAASAILSILLPEFSILKNEYLSILIALLISIPLYVCASSSVPVALTLYTNGFSFGAILAFLIAGPATNFVSIFTVKKILGSQILKIYLILIFILSFLASIIFNLFNFNISTSKTFIHIHHSTLDTVITAIFCVMIFVFYFINIFTKKKN